MTLRSVVSSVLIVVAVGCSGSGSSEDSRKESPSQASSGSAAAPSAPVSGPARSDMDCKTFLQKAGEMSKSMDMQMVFEEGSWGPVPAPLQALPSGVTLCGAGYFPDKKSGEPKKASGQIMSVMIKTSLFGKDLKAAYDPIMTKAGCTFERDISGSSTSHLAWNCPKQMCGPVTMLTDVAYNFGSFACIIP